MAYSPYDRSAEFFHHPSAYLGQPLVAPHYEFYAPAAPAPPASAPPAQSLSQQQILLAPRQEPVIPYGWRPDWSSAAVHSEWAPIQQPTPIVQTHDNRRFTYLEENEQKTIVYKPLAREAPVNKPFCCQICGKSFSQAANLTAHKRVHTGEKPFECSICNRPFSQSSSLVTHRRTHTGERPYPCKHCDKAFTDSSTLTKHLRTHTGQKPYGCPLCQMRFTQSGNLHRHMKTHKH